MRIAVQAADLDSRRIDGTRVYIWQLLKRFGKIAPEDRFSLYHKSDFNPELRPENYENYTVREIHASFLWTQTRFAAALWKDVPNRLWMPMHAMPILKPPGLETTVTIHDLAFKKFPDHFPSKDVWHLNFLTKQAVERSDRIIAISESTKRDILEYYPRVAESKIRVIHHGFDASLSEQSTKDLNDTVFTSYGLRVTGYILYVGAIQPRKNIEALVEAFEKLKKRQKYRDLKLVLAGEKAWLWQKTMQKIEDSEFRRDIVVTGTIPFEDLRALYAGASMFVFPSLYEGFGLPVLEAFASGVPVICANNSSLPEVGGDAALYFDAMNPDELMQRMQSFLSDESLRAEYVGKGKKQLKKFSWDKCAKETLEWIRNCPEKNKKTVLI